MLTTMRYIADVFITLFQADFKYDGQRAQVHYLEGGQVVIFSRHLKEMTAQYPDVIDALRRSIDLKATATDRVRSCILDAEIVAVNKDTAAILPFSTLMTRKKTVAADGQVQVEAMLLIFDVM